MNYKKFCWAGLLWLLGLFHGAVAQELPGPIALEAQVPLVSLDGRSAFWVDPTGTATIEQVATDATANWRVRTPAPQYNIDTKALWVRFYVLPQHNQSPWFLEPTSFGLGRVRLLRLANYLGSG